MDALKSIFAFTLIDVNNGLKVDIVAKSRLATEGKFRRKLAAGMLPTPVRTNMNSKTALRIIKSITMENAGLVLIKTAAEGKVDRKMVHRTGKCLIGRGGSWARSEIGRLGWSRGLERQGEGRIGGWRSRASGKRRIKRIWLRRKR